MTNLVDRLHRWSEWEVLKQYSLDAKGARRLNDDVADAAAEIERLRAVLKRIADAPPMDVAPIERQWAVDALREQVEPSGEYEKVYSKRDVEEMIRVSLLVQHAKAKP